MYEACPEEFKDEKNPWTEYAFRIHYDIIDLTGESLRWKSNDQEVRESQIEHFEYIAGIYDSERHWILAWMLSEMLLDVPED